MDEAAKTVALDGLARRVIGPYIAMSIFLFLMGLGVRLAHLPDIETEEDDNLKEANARKTSIFAFPHLLFGVLALFFYIGAEVIAGDTIIRYGISLKVPLNSAKYFTSLVMISMVLGYLIGLIFIPKYLNQRIALMASAVLGIILSFLAVLVPGDLALSFKFIDLTTFRPILLTVPYTVAFVALFGLANALVWPAVWPLAIHGLGSFIKTGSALLIMAIAGGAILPLVWGRLSDSVGSTQAYWIMIPCYCVIFAFSVWGYKLKSWK
jgi:fucose permease